MTKIDFKRELSHLYKASIKSIAEVDVPELRFLMVDGVGDPNTSPQYVEAVQALFSISYTAKFIVKKGKTQKDYAVMPLEGLWWAEDFNAFLKNDRTAWQWTMMIMQPEFATDAIIEEATDKLRKKGELPALPKVRLERFREGLCAQILHKGPFTEEGPTIEKLHQHIESVGKLSGKHHEIYLSDIRRAKPENWKTIIRQPLEY